VTRDDSIAAESIMQNLDNRAKVAASAATPECSLAHNRRHSKECLTAQR